MGFTIKSESFKHNAMIPVKYTCDGQGISPQLEWSGVPSEAQSLALIVSDPDAPDPAAPKMTWVHWMLYNMPVSAQGLPENVSTAALPPGTIEGVNGWGRPGYGGPCPPIGKHRYFFKLYALNTVLEDLGQLTKIKLEQAFSGHVLAKTELVGMYQRSR